MIRSSVGSLKKRSFRATTFVALVDSGKHCLDRQALVFPVAPHFGCLGPRLDAEEAAFFRDVAPVGFILFARNLDTLCEDKENLPVYEARFEIDRRFREDLNRFAEARETMIHVFGIQGYANVMSAFAAGERYINRVWSASTDGYLEEVNRYLEKARNQFIDANGLFRQLRSQESAADEDAGARAQNV